MVQQYAGASDFDFLFGSWRIENERLAARLANSTAWERFAARGECGPLLGGLGNVDQFWAQWRGMDFAGATVRVFNPVTGEWSIYWADNVSCKLWPPVAGRFVDGVGEFFGDDEHDGMPVLVRFRWSGITTESARWEQAFSTDRGATWETNWIMTFARQ